MSKETFCRFLDEAVADEEKAKKFYEDLKKAVEDLYPSEIIKQSLIKSAIDEVASAEKGHRELFIRLKETLCK